MSLLCRIWLIRTAKSCVQEKWKKQSFVYSRINYCTESFKKYNWQQPEGCDIGVKVYNTATRSVVPLLLQNENLVKWYICGPTVYDEAHIGHATCYVRFDILRRLLEGYFNVEVFMAMSITDIDDKIIHKSLEMGISSESISQHYEKEFFRDMNALRVLPPTKICRVTEHMDEIVSFCEKILEKGFAYVTVDGTVYFNAEQFGKSGPFTIPGDDLKPRVFADPHKRNQCDFALWKGVKPGEPSWNSPWGKGRPGWHIECSVMASDIFGDKVDIHSGGQDLMFPHHENEEIQSEAFHDHGQWVNYWIHSGLLNLKDSAKMSKSLNNSITVKEFLKENTANDFRMMCLLCSYRNVIEYSSDVLELAKNNVKRLKSFVEDCEAYLEGQLTCGPIDELQLLKHLQETKLLVRRSLENDFNTSQSLKAVSDLIGQVQKSFSSKTQKNDVPRNIVAVSACLSYVLKTTKLFGIDLVTKQLLTTTETVRSVLPDVMDALLDFRSKVRLHALTAGPQSQPQYKMAQSKESKEEGILPRLPEQPLETNTEWTHHDQKKLSKLARKEKDPLLEACDHIRSALYNAGVKIQDRGKHSSWSLLDDYSLEARKSVSSSHDTFEPNYQPKNTK